jgi:hypothetical protein
MVASLPADRQNIVHGRDDVAHGTSEKTGDAIGGREDRITEATDRFANLLGRAAMDVWDDMPATFRRRCSKGRRRDTTRNARNSLACCSIVVPKPFTRRSEVESRHTTSQEPSSRARVHTHTHRY